MKGLYQAKSKKEKDSLWAKACSDIKPKLGLGSLFKIPIFSPLVSVTFPISAGVGPQKGAGHF